MPLAGWIFLDENIIPVSKTHQRSLPGTWQGLGWPLTPEIPVSQQRDSAKALCTRAGCCSVPPVTEPSSAWARLALGRFTQGAPSDEDARSASASASPAFAPLHLHCSSSSKGGLKKKCHICCFHCPVPFLPPRERKPARRKRITVSFSLFSDRKTGCRAAGSCGHRETLR